MKIKITESEQKDEAFVELPAELLARMRWEPGDELELVDLPDGFKLVSSGTNPAN